MSLERERLVEQLIDKAVEAAPHVVLVTMRQNLRAAIRALRRFDADAKRSSGEHDPDKHGCKYLGNDTWSCGHIDNQMDDEEQHDEMAETRAAGLDCHGQP